MPKTNSNASDKAHGNIGDTVNTMLSEVATTSSPVVIAGVQRKANIGNFETIDIYCAAAFPIDATNLNQEELMEKMSAKIEELFHLTSKETGERYTLIKG
jgi:hypothetical protein